LVGVGDQGGPARVREGAAGQAFVMLCGDATAVFASLPFLERFLLLLALGARKRARNRLTGCRPRNTKELRDGLPTIRKTVPPPVLESDVCGDRQIQGWICPPCSQTGSWFPPIDAGTLDHNPLDGENYSKWRGTETAIFRFPQNSVFRTLRGLFVKQGGKNLTGDCHICGFASAHGKKNTRAGWHEKDRQIDRRGACRRGPSGNGI